VHCTTPFSDSGAKPQQGTYCLVDDTGYRKLPRENIWHPKPEWRRSFYHDRKWPEPEATLDAGGVRRLGSTCRRSVGPDPPLVTPCCRRWSSQLDVGRPDHLEPLFIIFCHEPDKIGWRTRKDLTAQLSNPRLHAGGIEDRVNLPVEPIDGFGRRVLGCGDAQPYACSKPAR